MPGNLTAESLLTRGNITYFPVVPGRLEFAWRVRRFLLERRPGVVAVELPSSLEKLYRKALDRLPQMSVILIPEDQLEDEEEPRATYIPGGTRRPVCRGAAHRRGTWLAKSSSLNLPPTKSRTSPILIPAAYSLEIIGVTAYIEAYRVHPQPRTPQLEAHAAAMAWKMQGADPLASVCAVVSLNMLDPLLDAMEVPQEPPPTAAHAPFPTR